MTGATQAASITWGGGGADNNFQTAANWNTAASAGDTLFFGGTTRLTANNNFTAGTAFGGINFNSDAGAFTLAGNQIKLQGDVANNSANLQTINFDMVLDGADRTFNTAAGNITVGGVVSGSYGLVKTGAYTLTMNKAATFTGGVTVSSGTLVNAIANGLGSANALIMNGGVLELKSNNTFTSLSGTGGIITNNGTADTVLTVNTTANTTFGGIIQKGSKAVGLTKTGTGTLTLTGANTLGGGAVTISGGQLVLGNRDAISGGELSLNVNNGLAFAGGIGTFNVGGIQGGGALKLEDADGSAVTMALNLGATRTYSGAISGAGSLYVKSAVNVIQNLNGNISLSGGITAEFTGGGSVYLRGDNSGYTGTTTLNAGTLVLDSATALGSSGSIVFNGGSLAFMSCSTDVSSRIASVASGKIVNVAVVSGSTVNFASSISGSGGLSLGGGSASYRGGTLILSASNSFAGNVDATYGTLILDHTYAASGGTLTNGASTGSIVFGNSTSDFTVGGVGLGSNGALSLSNANGGINLTTNVAAGKTASSSGTITGAGSLIMDGQGTQSLNGTNNLFTGGILIKSGTLQIATTNGYVGRSVTVNGGVLLLTNQDALGTGTGASRVTMNGGLMRIKANNSMTVSSLNGSADAVIASPDSGSGSAVNLTITTTGHDTFAGQLKDGISTYALGFNMSGSGTMTLSGVNNTYTGRNIFNGGVVEVTKLSLSGVASSIGASNGANNTMFFDGGTLRYIGSGDTTDRAFTINAGGATLDASGSGALVISNPGMNLAFGTGTNANVAVTFTLTGTNTADNTFGKGLSDNGTGALTLVKSGAGTWVLGNTYTYTGETRIQDGTLKVSGANKLNTTAGNIVISGGTFDLNGFSQTKTTGEIVLSGGTITSGTISKTTAGSGAFDIRSGTVTSSGVLAGAAGLTKTTSGTATVAGNNTYTGVTAINGGVLAVANLSDGGVASGIGSSSASASSVLINGGALRYIGAGGATNRLFTVGVNGATLDASGSGAIKFSNTGAVAFATGNQSADIGLTGSNAADNEFATKITDNGSGAVSVTKSGEGKWVLSAENTYTGDTTVNQGTLEVAGSLAAGSAVKIGAGATLSGGGTISGSISGTSAHINGSGLKLGATTLYGSSTLSGSNSASGVTIAGGTTTLTGVTASASALSVLAGATLDNTGTVTGSVLVGGLLKGSGTITQNLTIQGGGTLAPGNSPGTTTVNGNFTMQDNSTLVSEVLSSASYDQVKVTAGDVMLGLVTLDLTTLSGLSLGETIALIDNEGSGTLTGFFSTVLTNGGTVVASTDTSYRFTLGEMDYLVSYGSFEHDGRMNDITLSALETSAIPEPSTWAMLMGGLGMLTFAQRIRRRHYNAK